MGVYWCCEESGKPFSRRGYVNPRNGKAYTPYAVWVAAMRWVIYHMDEARPYYIAEGSTLAEDERLWSEWVIKKAIRLLGDSSVDRFMAWVKDNGLEKYDYAYAEHFGKEPKYTREV